MSDSKKFLKDLFPKYRDIIEGATDEKWFRRLRDGGYHSIAQADGLDPRCLEYLRVDTLDNICEKSYHPEDVLYTLGYCQGIQHRSEEENDHMARVLLAIQEASMFISLGRKVADSYENVDRPITETSIILRSTMDTDDKIRALLTIADSKGLIAKGIYNIEPEQ
jgi:hypothetical protein